MSSSTAAAALVAATTTTTTSTTAPVVAATTAGVLGPTPKRHKARPSPYSKVNPILLSSDRQARKRKSITWLPDDKIRQVHYFELIADERINVTRTNACGAAGAIVDPQQQSMINADANASLASSSLNSGASTAGSSSNNKNNNLLKTPNAVGGLTVDSIRRSDKCIEYLSWRPLILIDFASELPSPGWNSLERSAQAERETYVLGAIDLPGQASTLDEPDQQPKLGQQTTTTSTNNNENNTSNQHTTTSNLTKIIPLENPEGICTEYTNMYNIELGTNAPTNHLQHQLQQHYQQQLLPMQAATNMGQLVFMPLGLW